MNIFYLDQDPETCAQYHCDKHVVKMILETAQLLCATQWLCGNEAQYRLTHKNHPSTIWTRQSIHNYRWLCELGIQLGLEYTLRYGKIHKSQAVVEWCRDNEPLLPDIPFTNPPQAMPDYCKLDDTVLAYRKYYINEKSGFAKWKTTTPEWFRPMEVE
jgi:hypothetical protein